MSLISSEIQELDRLKKRVIEGKISHEELSSHIEIYKQTGLRHKLTLDAIKMVAVHHVLTMKDLHHMNLISCDANPISIVESFEDEKIECPALNGEEITRGECLDYSGETENVDSCRKCGNFVETRKVLMGGHS